MQTSLVHLYVGDGKGKTSIAIGSAIRAAGSGLKVLFFQFLKNGDSSEVVVLKSIKDIIYKDNPIQNTFVNLADYNQVESYRALYRPIIKELECAIKSKEYDMVVLDEALDAYNIGIFPELALLMKENKDVELIITGHEYKGVSIDALLESADYVTYLKKEKHPFDQGIFARRGIEF